MAKSEYLQREEAAKKQLGTKGVKKRVKQLPTAARAFTREMTGVDISRKGVSVDPLSLAMALPVGKVLKAAKALRAAGKVEQAAALSARAGAKTRGTKIGRYSAYWDVSEEGDSFIDLAKSRRVESESMFPRVTKKGK